MKHPKRHAVRGLLLCLAVASVGIESEAATVTYNGGLTSPITVNEGQQFTVYRDIASYTLTDNSSVEEYYYSLTYSGTTSGANLNGSFGVGFTGSAAIYSYADEGSYVFSDTATLTFDRYTRGFFGWSYAGRFSVSDTNQATVTVQNVAPTINSFALPSQVTVGQSFTFSANAFDPGIFDALSFAWDFTGADGLSYTDAVGKTGSWTFGGAGTYQGRLRVGDGDGGFAFRDFSITANDPTPAPVEPTAVPLPASALSGLLLLAGLVARRRQTNSANA